jgi:hypothetical protein
MTMLEALRIMGQELGMSEEEIAFREKSAIEAFPTGNGHINSGEEREFITELKLLFMATQSLSGSVAADRELEQLTKLLAEEAERN